MQIIRIVDDSHKKKETCLRLVKKRDSLNTKVAAIVPFYKQLLSFPWGMIKDNMLLELDFYLEKCFKSEISGKTTSY